MGLNLGPILQSAPDSWNLLTPGKEPVSFGEVGKYGWNLAKDDILLPVLAARRSALEHNTRVMADYCQEHEISLAPHGKTAMAPQLLALQLEMGAWGVSVATTAQARAYRTFGAERILIANQVHSPPALKWVTTERLAYPDLFLCSLVDSEESVTLMERALSGFDLRGREMPVLVELGVANGRAGCRDDEVALRVADRVWRSTSLNLQGLAGYEGAVSGGRSAASLAQVDRFLTRLRDLTSKVARQGWFAGCAEVIVSAGGSVFPDRVPVALVWDEPVSPPVRVLMRSGAYMFHDDGYYAGVSPFGRNGTGQLRPALELWAEVLSCPEPGLAIIGFGRRNAPYDSGLPVPRRLLRSNGEELELDAGTMQVEGLNDEHAFLRDKNRMLKVGDKLVFGISHPCTAIDRWRVLLVIDDNGTVIDAVRTFF
jgi:D-serine deaminase-like pyridoxal phosphate-dependent protein